MTDFIRPDRRALLELDAVLDRIERLCGAGNRDRYDCDDTYRWAIHRLWIAAGNEALHYVKAVGRSIYHVQPWRFIYEQRNHLAHHALADIDDDEVWRVTVLRTAGYRRRAQDLLT